MSRHDPDQPHPEQPHPEQLDSSAQEWLRGLLADARVDPGAEAMPDDVRARLDDALAGLRPERETGPETGTGDATPVPLLPPYRRWAPRLVAAAAAVLVLGGGGYLASQAVHGGGSDAESTTAADAASSAAPQTKDSAEQTPRSATSSPPAARAESGDAASGDAGSPGDMSALTRQLEDAPVISVDDTRADVFLLGAQVARGQRLSYYATHAAPALNGTSPLSDAVTQGLFGDTFATKGETGTVPQVQDAGGSGCAGPSVTDSVSLRVRYDGGLAVVVLHAPTGSTSASSGPTALSAELWTCDGSKTLVSTPVG